jgi:hypothetical protein
MTHDSDLAVEAERIQASGVLGEARVRRLFDYLVASSLAGQSPKEIAIAVDVFGKSADFDTGQDALVRVYIHKLRKALEEFYASHASAPAGTLSIPRGEYRLKFIPGAAVAEPEPPRRETLRWQAKRWPKAAVVVAVILAAAASVGWGVVWFRNPDTELDLVRASPPWSAILKDDRPIMIVVGDYYLIGELDDMMGVKRLIREYTVNSKNDLDNYVLQHPEVADRYMDVGMRYLPIAAAFALRNVMAVLAPADRRITVVKMSDLEPGNLKTADIVYVGYLSGLGMMQDFAFSGSRFAVGDSYDEIVDKKSHRSYLSQTWGRILGPPPPSGTAKTYNDYGFFESFRGPGGNPVIVITGTQDAGVQQAAEALTNPEKLKEIARQANLAQPFEALLEVSTIDGVNLSGKLLLAAERDVSNAACANCKAANNTAASR